MPHQSENTGVRSLFGYAEDEEIEALRALRERRDAAHEEARRLTLRAAEIEAEAAAAKQRAATATAKRRAALVHAAVSGGEPPSLELVLEAGNVAADAAVAADEVRRHAEERRAEGDNLHRELRAAVAGLAAACMQRAGHDYLAAAQRVGTLHAIIGAGHRLGDLKAVLGFEWDQVLIPNPALLDALRDVGVVRGAKHLRLPIVGGDAAIREATEAAVEEAKADVRTAIGEFPTERR